MKAEHALKLYTLEAARAKKWMLILLFVTGILFIMATGTQVTRIEMTISLFVCLVGVVEAQYFFLVWQENLAKKRQIELFESIQSRGMHPQLLLRVHQIAARMAVARDISTTRPFRSWTQVYHNITRRS